MKKALILLAGIALIAASCAKTEVVSSGPDGAEKGISFSAYTARPICYYRYLNRYVSILS